jgi:hypothetical protein
MNITTGSRLFADTAAFQHVVPRRVRTRIAGKVRTARTGAITICCRTEQQLLDAARSGSSAVMLPRDLTATERQTYSGRLVWVDGDVLLAQSGNAACTAGMSLADARALLTVATPPAGRLYAPASPLDGDPELLFGLPEASGSGRVYGPNVQIVDEQDAIRAVASDPTAVAAVAWSAARAALSAGSVCELPIDGVTATEATLRDGSYPASIHATFVVARKHPFGAAWLRHWYLDGYLASAKTRKLLQTADDRDRLLP